MVQIYWLVGNMCHIDDFICILKNLLVFILCGLLDCYIYMEKQSKFEESKNQKGQEANMGGSYKTKQNLEKAGKKGQEIMRHENYSIRKLTTADRHNAMERLIREYTDQQPLSIGFCRQFTQKKKDLQKEWRDFYGAYIDYSIENGCGVAMFDLNNNQELIGVSITRDMTYVAQDFKKNTLNTFNFGNPMMFMQSLMIKKAKPEEQQALKTKGCVMNIYGVALTKKHMGKQLLHKMMLANEELGKKQGFKYGYIYACNVKSGIAGKKIGYEKIGEYDCHELVVDGKKPFQMVDPAHQFTSIWLKKLA